MNIATTIWYLSVWISGYSALEYVVSNEEQIRWAVTSVRPGDTILIANRTIFLNSTLSTMTNANEQTPIRMKGTGTASILHLQEEEIPDPINTISCINVLNSHWIFEDFKITGAYNAGIYVNNTGRSTHPEQTTIQRMTFLNSSSPYPIGVEVNIGRTTIENCSFHLRHGVHAANLEFQFLPLHITIRNCTFLNVGNGYQGITMRRVNEAVIENNVFDIVNNETAAWTNFVQMLGSKVFLSGNVGRKASREGFLVQYVASAVSGEEYVFIRNHCDLQFDVWCLHFNNVDMLRNKTTIAGDNTYENGRGLTNMP